MAIINPNRIHIEEVDLILSNVDEMGIEKLKMLNRHGVYYIKFSLKKNYRSSNVAMDMRTVHSNVNSC